MEVYFEDLEDKLEQIVSDIMLLEEHIDSIEDAFKTIVDINTNFTVKLLTIFSAFLLPLTLITSFYGMNIDLPLQNSPQLVFIILIMTLLFM
jgi:magnesium transporter